MPDDGPALGVLMVGLVGDSLGTPWGAGESGGEGRRDASDRTVQTAHEQPRSCVVGERPP